jgi:hypothetical protein
MMQIKDLQQKSFSRTPDGNLEVNGLMPVKLVFSKEQMLAMINDMRTKIVELEELLAELDRLPPAENKSE